MGYPLIESPIGALVFINGDYYPVTSAEVEALKDPYDKLSYYETIRLIGGRPLFWEEHLARLERSVSSDTEDVISLDGMVEDIRGFLMKTSGKCFSSLRIVAAADYRVIHYVDIKLPAKEDFDKGIVSASLCWERQAPNIKAFRGDYKAAVAKVFEDTNAFELILADNNGKLYEGSKSNFFAIVDGTVYSAPDDKILIGITRNRVIEALKDQHLDLKTDMFTLNELKESNASLFVSSTPFDILPVASVDGIEFDSARNPVLQGIMRSYKESQVKYLSENKFLEE
jgi:branched-chain amino acid aminotransferase